MFINKMDINLESIIPFQLVDNMFEDEFHIFKSSDMIVDMHVVTQSKIEKIQKLSSENPIVNPIEITSIIKDNEDL